MDSNTNQLPGLSSHHRTTSELVTQCIKSH